LKEAFPAQSKAAPKKAINNPEGTAPSGINKIGVD